MSIDRLQYFAAVVETKNLRKAADLVGISSGSMSKAISTLEKELGLSLIRPEGRGIAITDSGLNVYQNSIPLLEEYRRFHNQVRQRVHKQIKHQQMTLGTFEVFSSYFLTSFLVSNPKISEVRAIELMPTQIEQGLLDCLIDYGLTYLPSPHPQLSFHEIGSFQMGIFGRPLWGDKLFKDWPFAIPTTEVQIRSSDREALDLWPQKAPSRKIKYQFELLETALQMAGQGLAVIHCPTFIAQLYNHKVKDQLRIESLPFPEGYTLDKPTKVFLVTKKDQQDSTVERKLARFMRSLK